MNILTQPDTPTRLPDRFELRTERDRSARTEGSHAERPIPGAIDVGCVDWYLYGQPHGASDGILK